MKVKKKWVFLLKQKKNKTVEKKLKYSNINWKKFNKKIKSLFLIINQIFWYSTRKFMQIKLIRIKILKKILGLQIISKNWKKFLSLI